MNDGKKTSSFRLTTLIVVIAVHVGAVFIPLGVMLFTPEKPKQIPFRVKIGGIEPSSASIVGPPTRVRPTGNEGNGDTPPPPPPVVKQKPKPVVKTKIDKRRQQQLAQQKRLQEERRRQQQLAQQKRLQEERRRQQRLAQQKRLQEERRRRLQQEVYQDKRWKNWDPNKPAGGGTNTNIAVPIGPRNQGQTIGKNIGGTPAGGATPDEAKYWEKFQDYLYERWRPPAGIFVTAETAVLFELQWDARGRIVAKRIISASSNPAVTQSVKMMLDNLDYIPAPPHGMASRSSQFRMVSQ